jgi:hypothetical protein
MPVIPVNFEDETPLRQVALMTRGYPCTIINHNEAPRPLEVDLNRFGDTCAICNNVTAGNTKLPATRSSEVNFGQSLGTEDQ